MSYYMYPSATGFFALNIVIMESFQDDICAY